MATTLLKIAADLQLSLAAAVTVGQTTATLSSASDSDGTALPSGKYGFTIDGDTSAKEYIVCDLVGTALTGIQNITRQGTASTGFANYHRFGATVTITDWAILSRMLNNLNGTTGFDSGTNIGYDGAPAGLTGNQFATVNYVLSVVSGGTVSFNQQILSGMTAGENLTVNDLVYFKESDQKWWKVDADTLTTFSGLHLGFALATTLANATLSIQLSGSLSGFTGLTAGSKYYASGTAGAITATAPSTPTYQVFVGYALSTTVLLLDLPYSVGAESGTLGFPSGVNRFITELNETTGGTDQSQTTQNATVIFGESDATSEQNKIAQSFIPTGTKIRGVSLYKIADSGTFTGTVKVALQADTTGSPSGSDLASVTLTNAQWLRVVTGEFNAIFTTEYTSLVLGSLYWIVLSTSTADNTNHPNVGSNSAGGYANGSVKFNNTTDGWVAIATIDLYFKTLVGNTSQVVLTGSDGYVAPSLVPQLVGSDTTSVSIANGNSAAETTLFVRSIPAGLLGTRNVLRARLYFSAIGLSSAGESLTLRVKYGSTTVNTITLSGGVAISTSGYMIADLVANNSASAQIGTCELDATATGRELATDATVGISKILGNASGTATENSATTLDFTITGQYGGTNAANDLTVLYGYVEVIRQ